MPSLGNRQGISQYYYENNVDLADTMERSLGGHQEYTDHTFKITANKIHLLYFCPIWGTITLSESFALASVSGSWLTCRHFTPLLTNLVFQAAHAHTQMLFAFLGRKEKKKNLCAQCPEELADSRLSSSLDFLQHELLLGTLNSWQPGPASSDLLILLSSSLEVCQANCLNGGRQLVGRNKN